MKIRNGIYGMVGMGLIFMGGCGVSSPDTQSTSSKDSQEQASIALTVNIQTGSDVDGFRYTINTCDDEEVLVAEKSLEDLTLPGNMEEFQNEPFDENSSHEFSDLFSLIAAGCYNVTVQPITESGDDSEDCYAVTANDIIVAANQTTEILLVSQCEGPDVGAIDIIAALNHPPVMTGFTYDSGKFVQCEEDVTICVTAFDYDEDPMEFDWAQLLGEEIDGGLVVSDSGENENGYYECITFAPASAGKYEFQISAFDLFHIDDGEGGTTLVRAEDWLNDNGYEDIESRATLVVPLHVDCDDDGDGDDGDGDDGDGDDGDGDDGDGDDGDGDGELELCERTNFDALDEDCYFENTVINGGYTVEEDEACTFVNVTINGPFGVEAGASVLANNLTINGAIDIDGAASVVIYNSTFTGALNVEDGGSLEVCDSQLLGALDIEALTGDVVIAHSALSGNTDIEECSGSISIVENTFSGGLSVSENTGAILISDNTVNGVLDCLNNSLPPTGSNNSANGGLANQCSGL